MIHTSQNYVTQFFQHIFIAKVLVCARWRKCDGILNSRFFHKIYYFIFYDAANVIYANFYCAVVETHYGKNRRNTQFISLQRSYFIFFTIERIKLIFLFIPTHHRYFLCTLLNGKHHNISFTLHEMVFLLLFCQSLLLTASFVNEKDYL